MSVATLPRSRAFYIQVVAIDGGRPFPVEFTKHPCRLTTPRQHAEQARHEASWERKGHELYVAHRIDGWDILDSDHEPGTRFELTPASVAWWDECRRTLSRLWVPTREYRARPKYEDPTLPIPEDV